MARRAGGAEAIFRTMKRPLFTAGLFVAAFSFSSCAFGPRSQSTTATGGDGDEWTNDYVIGLTIELDDPGKIEWMSFSRDGLVPVTHGRRGGSIEGPLYAWKIVEGKLQILRGDQDTYDELTLISRNANTITARRMSGEVVRYKIFKRKESRKQELAQ
jgi:hypothetical protein